MNTHVHAQIKINEFIANNASGIIDPDFKQFSDWIELYNTTDSSINLKGYFLTDNPTIPVKWIIKHDVIINAGDFVIIWADSKDTLNHANFKLSDNGEFIGLCNPLIQLIDSVSYGTQQVNISQGRSPDASSKWSFFNVLTPGKSNSTINFFKSKISEAPIFSVKGGSYSTSQVVTITTVDTSALVKYTLDGSAPDLTSLTYNTPISIDTTTVVRAIAIEDSAQISTVITNTYLINENIKLPIVSISTNPAFLWDNEIGIYCLGYHANYEQDWERPAAFEFIDEQGKQQVSMNGGISLMGKIRYPKKKSFSFYARNKYGDKTIDYPFFSDKNISSFSSLFIRNGGIPDLYCSLIRDALIHTVVAGNIDIDYMAYRPTVLFLNGEYWGIYSIREKMNENYIVDNYKIPAANLNLIENRNEILVGDTLSYTNVINYLKNEDLSSQQAYAFINKNIDVKEYINYQITEIYSTNQDWPGNNIKYWRSNSQGSKWRWLLFDLDAGQGLWWYWGNESLSYATATNSNYWANPPWSTFLFRKLLEIPSFKNDFIQSFAHQLNTTFSKDKVDFYIDSLSSQIAFDIPRCIDRWKDKDTLGYSVTKILKNNDEWLAEIAILKICAKEGPPYLFNSINNYFGLSSTSTLTINANNGFVSLNDYEIKQPNYLGNYFNKVPITLVATALPGYRFLNWSGFSNSTNDTITITITDSSGIIANFIPNEKQELPAHFIKDTTLTIDDSPYLVVHDIVIDSNVTLTLDADVKWLLSDTIDIIVYGKLIINGTQQQPVVFSTNSDAYTKNWGAIRIINATDTSILKHLIITGATHGDNPISERGAINVINSSIVIDNVTCTDAVQPFYSEFANDIIIRNCTFESNYTCDLITCSNANKVLIENCDLKGGDAYDTDAIDFNNSRNGIIRNNNIYNFLGINNDGIDVSGYYNPIVLIENNKIYNIYDKGISIGAGANVIVKHNVFINCNMGSGIKDSLSYGYFENNTFYLCNYAVACYVKQIGRGGGTADIKNCIMNTCLINSILKDSLSTIQITYSLTDDDTIAGIGNIQGNPLFVNTMALNFELQNTSPCINTGDPTSPKDSDSTIVDMGALIKFNTTSTDKIVITEINYNSSLTDFSDDWVELHNCGTESVDLSGWTIKDNNDLNYYRLPQGTFLCADEYLVIAKDKHAFATMNPYTYNMIGNLGFNLSNAGDEVRLFDIHLNLVDRVVFDDSLPWPVNADGMGYTLELINCASDNQLVENWLKSDSIGGTPGYPITGHIVSINEVTKTNSFLVYPNPVTTQLSVINIEAIDNRFTEIQVINMLGQVELSQKTNIEKIIIDVSELAAGIYFVKVGNQIQKFIKQ